MRPSISTAYPDIQGSSMLPIWARLQMINDDIPFNDVVGFFQTSPYCVDLLYYVWDGDGHHAGVHARWWSVYRKIG